MSENRLRRISIPVPNPALAEWLVGSECRAAVTEVTTEVFTAYRNALPYRTGQLQDSADMDVQIGGFGTDQDRWFGYITNSAPYAAAIEYGRRKYRPFPGQHQLARAAQLVAGGIGTEGGINLPGISRNTAGRGSQLTSKATGRFVANPLARDRGGSRPLRKRRPS